MVCKVNSLAYFIMATISYPRRPSDLQLGTVDVAMAGAMADFTATKYREKLERCPGDCGVDIYPSFNDISEIDTTDGVFCDILSVPTKVSLLVPFGYFAWVVGRSSSYERLGGAAVINGIIDSGYTGEYRIRIQMPKTYPPDGRTKHWLYGVIQSFVEHHVALAQVIIIPYKKVMFDVVDRLPNTPRGSQGYGSTDAACISGKNRSDPSDRSDQSDSVSSGGRL